MKTLTPNLIVEAIEPCLPFWLERLGFEKLDEVRMGDRLGFVILKNGGAQVMLQTLASVQDDVAPIAAGPHRSTLYVAVASLAEAKKTLGDWPLVVPERTTFYGARELIVADPAGNFVFLSEHT